MADRIYIDYTQDELDRAYDQRAWASDADAILAQCAGLGAEVRKSARYQADIPYGAGADETLDWFPSEGDGQAIHIHLHGGAWRALNKHDVSFVAPAFTTRGVHFVALDFTNLPKARLPDMVDQLVRAIAFVNRTASRFGGDPDRIFLSGHSSGAHLCAVLLTQNWSDHGLPPDVLKGGLCISGSYDLEPVMLSARRLYIDLTPDEIDRLSPIRHVDRIACPVDLVYGGHESPEFKRQALAFADVLAQTTHRSSVESFAAFNHFDMSLQFGHPDSAIHRKAMAQVHAHTPSSTSQTL